MDVSSKHKSIRVEPFIHQVGGHSSLLCLDDSTICKPLVPRELEFYKTLPESFRKFTPYFHGPLLVQVLPEDDDYVMLVATPPDCYQVQNPNNNAKSNRIRLRRSGSIEVDGETALFTEDQVESACSDSIGTAINPWVLKCHRSNLQKIVAENVEPNFILLENLAHNFSYPCILDLKMGTRQYGDAASLPKKQSKMFKVVSTTSGKLGVRIGGMQVYQVTSHRYICRNKFYGRSLSVAGFQQALCQFLHNGARLRVDVLPPLIRRLEELVDTLTYQDAIRFYTTSLLLLYEGEDDSTEPAETVKASLFDNLSPNAYYDDDLRRSSSAETLTPIVEETERAEPVARYKRRRSSATLDEANVSAQKLTSDRKTAEPLVDVRIIDFAHSTHKGMDDPVAYTGPDRGFLFGLENIIALLKGIEKNHG